MPKQVIIHPDFEAYREQLTSVLNDFNAVGKVVVQGERNTIKKITINSFTFSIKQFKTPNPFQSIVYQFFRKSKARRSFEYATRLIDSGIHTPTPVAYVEHQEFGLKESYYISEHIDYDFDFRTLNHNPNWPDRKAILEQVATFTFKLHENNINFLDHSPGNTLIKKTAGKEYQFYIIDLNRMRFESMDFNARMKNFRRLWLSKTMINIMAPVYAKLYGRTAQEVHDRMSFYSRQFQKKVNSKKLRRRSR